MNMKSWISVHSHSTWFFVLSHGFLAILVVATVFLIPAIRYLPIVEPSVRDIDPKVLAEQMKQDPSRFIFLDVRSKEMYDKLHAVGAKLQPLATLYNERHFLPRNDPNKTIVLICSGGLASGVAYSYLEHYGFRNIYRVKGGIEGWQAANLPVTGSDVI